MLHPSYGSGPVAGAPDSWGSGYYSREDYMDILKYAQQRHISVIPTINLPGHSRAAIKAMEARYKKFMKEGNEEKANEFRLIDPDDQSKYMSAQGYDDNVVCVARESVYKFYETVINDIIEMHAEAGVPLEFFHTGGDEVPNGAWSESPLCKKLMETLPEFKDPKNLQSYFLRRTVGFLAEKKLKVGGWEEVALIKNEEGKIVPNPEFVGKNVIPWAWNNQGEWANLSYRLANAGYPVVMCDVSKFYFDLAYNKDPQEPGLYWGGFCDTRDPWQFAPYNSFVTNQKTSDGLPIDPEKAFAGLERLKPEARKNIIGLQAQLWGETVKGPKMLEYYTLPKLISFAETSWGQPRPWENESNPVKRQQLMDEGWNLFANALAKRELPRLSGLFGGFNYRIPKPGAVIEGGMLKVNIEYPGLKIKYTADGSEPTFQSTIYKEPVQVTGEVKLKAFDVAGKSSRTVILR
jgi:hexosaminidase